MTLRIHIDGGARGNPGPGGAGVVIQSEEGERIHEGAYYLGRTTNNAAEYTALLHGLRRAERCKPERITIYSDSELMVRQLTGEYRVKSPSLAPLHEQAQLLLLRLGRWSIRHIAREENRRADELANLAMDQGRSVVVFDVEDEAPTTTVDAPTAPANGGSSSAPAGPRPKAQAGSNRGRTGQKPPDQRPRPAPEALRVRVDVARPPARAACPAVAELQPAYEVGACLPAGLCLHAAHALLPTIIAMRNSAAGEFHAMPMMTLRCAREGCEATFHVAPADHGNGRHPADGASAAP